MFFFGANMFNQYKLSDDFFMTYYLERIIGVILDICQRMFVFMASAKQSITKYRLSLSSTIFHILSHYMDLPFTNDL